MARSRGISWKKNSNIDAVFHISKTLSSSSDITINLNDEDFTWITIEVGNYTLGTINFLNVPQRAEIILEVNLGNIGSKPTWGSKFEWGEVGDPSLKNYNIFRGYTIDSGTTWNIKLVYQKNNDNSPIYVCGDNYLGQLAFNDTVNRSSLSQVGSDEDWKSNSIGMHVMYIKTNNTLWTCGNNGNGQLGLGDIVDRSSLSQIGNNSNWNIVLVKNRFTIAIKTDGTLWSWGYNNHGQLGLGDIIDRSSPVQIGSGTNWKSIGLGTDSCFGIKTDGTLWSWGYNDAGQLGVGDIIYRSSPIQVGSLTDWNVVIGGSNNTLALKTDGTLWSWGYNGNGQLGLGDTSHRSSPVQVGSDTDWKEIAAGGFHCLTIKTDGTLWSWGYGEYGQLGDGGNGFWQQVSSPTQVGGLTNWDKVSAGTYHSASLKTDGTLWAWGMNAQGPLGLNDTSHRSSPVQVGSNTNWDILSCGYRNTSVIKKL